MPLGKAVKRLAVQKLLCDLTLELNAMGSVSCHGLFSKSPANRSIQLCFPVRPKGPTPEGGAYCTLILKLRDHFAAWIRQLPPPVEGTYSLIRSVDPGALFLTFNYTPTLETLYGATPANVLHIHGNASVASDQIVLGHGWERLDEEKLSPKVHEDTDTRFAGGYRLIDSYFADTFKPTIALIERNSGFFGRISNVDEVFVLGHSLSEIDAPYLHEVIRRIRPDATWTVSYHGSSAEAEDRMNGLGVSPALSRFHPLSLL
ncbi:bacteriophage abortive infection AbiH family protein [Sphingopyxis sp. FD7]|uniref:bacteriophage abortive infection AbiH family protein n=1 Tax=Sphingopyxis sp. FD7 TaxID=1914525 RepID=UPI000DC61301|nr:bacteriophage abortive infection AbiH family protein [Sphingopyxis sp. FD7]BBB12895.1 hypothetical protein SPYCA_2153 [Sphingopyxis sp. FD7]